MKCNNYNNYGVRACMGRCACIALTIKAPVGIPGISHEPVVLTTLGSPSNKLHSVAAEQRAGGVLINATSVCQEISVHCRERKKINYVRRYSCAYPWNTSWFRFVTLRALRASVSACACACACACMRISYLRKRSLRGRWSWSQSE